MRVATLTTHYACNYGALLQTHALLLVLNRMPGVEAETLAYYPSNSNRSWSVFYPGLSIRNVLCNILILLSPSILKGRRTRIIANRKFIEAYIQKSSLHCTTDIELVNAAKEYDYIIVGSDQVWNTALMPNDTCFLCFLDDRMKPKRIAYAASICEPIIEQRKERIKESLSRFHAISIREKEDISKISELTKTEVSIMPDPVYLPSTKYWDNAAILPKVDQPYILCYFIGGERAASDIVNAISKKLGYIVINLATGFRKSIIDAKYPEGVGPFEFIGYIKNAALVLTNSFHCVSFSIIYHKPFFVCSTNYARKSRIDGVMQRYCFESRYIDMATVDIMPREQLMNKTEYNTRALNTARDDGIAFLRDNIEND